MSGPDEIVRAAPVIGRARIFASGRSAETAIEPAGLSIPRAVLDLVLWECAQQAGVTAHSKCEVLAIDGEGPYTVSTARGEFGADRVILCTGRWSRFSDSSLVASGPKWIGVKAHYRERNPAPSTDLYFFDNGYCGVQPVGQDAVNVCALVRSDAATTLEAVFQRSPPVKGAGQAVGADHRSREYRAGSVSQAGLSARQDAARGGCCGIHRSFCGGRDFAGFAQRTSGGGVHYSERQFLGRCLPGV